MSRCILCKRELSGNEPPEHVLLNALGGRMEVEGVLCRPCNQERLGAGPDSELAESARFIRMMMGFRSGNRRSPPPVRDVDVSGQKIKLEAGGIPILEGNPPFKITETDDGLIGLEMTVGDQQDLDRVIPHLAGRLRISEPAARKLLTEAKWEHRTEPVGVVEAQMGFGGTTAIRSMAKACLVLWAHNVGNDEVLHLRYDDIRAFILDGDDDMTRRLSRLDVRPWPSTFTIADAFGPFANVVYVASDAKGRLIGYFRLYGMIGWCIELAPEGASPNQAVGLASNPECPADRSERVALSHPLDFSWLDNPTCDVGFGTPKAALAKMLKQQMREGYERELSKICSTVFGRYGYGDDDPLPDNVLSAIINELSAHAAALFCRMPMRRPLTPQEIAYMTRGAAS